MRAGSSLFAGSCLRARRSFFAGSGLTGWGCLRASFLLWTRRHFPLRLGALDGGCAGFSGACWFAALRGSCVALLGGGSATLLHGRRVVVLGCRGAALLSCWSAALFGRVGVLGYGGALLLGVLLFLADGCGWSGDGAACGYGSR